MTGENGSREGAPRIERFTFGVTTERLEETRDFYVRLLGFQIVFEQSWFAHLRSPGGECEIGVLRPDRPEVPAAFGACFGGAGAWISFNVPDVEALLERCRALGITPEFGLREQAWGERHFGVRDPAGVLVNFAQRIPPSGDYARSTGKGST